ncbi:MAG TPA: hypothetical protein DEA08_06430 [Planctomycetes bacterium]|nr:hypothetical protein [Planctomycetota bacterium]
MIAALALAGCAAPVVDVTVSEPKVYGDDQVLRTLAGQRARLTALADGIEPGDYQEAFGVRSDERRRSTLSANLAAPAAPSPQPPPLREEGRGGRWPGIGRLGYQDYPPYARPPQPGLGFREELRRRVDGAQQLASYELLFLGDTRLLDGRSRAALLRFDLSFNNYVDLGARRRFVVVEFVVKPKRAPAPRFSVYLLTPEYSAMVSRERALTRLVSEYAGQLLGSWGGIGVTGSHGASRQTREDFEALLETPLQFAVYDSRELPAGGRRFAFAFGPRRRLHERGALNPARWFGANYEVVYELQPGPRTCQALLLFHDVSERASLELEVEVFCDGRLVAEEDVDLARALRRGRKPLETFEVRCPKPLQSARTKVVRVDPQVATDLLIEAGPKGPSFSPESEVFVGPARVPAHQVRFLGRGRLSVRVRPSATLRAARGARLTGRVVTPDQPDFVFCVELSQGKAP